MNVLAVDTSTNLGVIGIGTENQVIAEIAVQSKETHSARLLPAIDWALKSCGLTIADIDLFGVTTGPGSFTGLRIGLSTMKGFAWVTKKPLVGLSSLDILAKQLPVRDHLIVPMIDAFRKRVFSASYRWRDDMLETVLPPADLDPGELCTKLSGSFITFGTGARKYGEVIRSSQNKGIEFATTDFDYPRGATLVRESVLKFNANQLIDVQMSEPLYLNPTELDASTLHFSA